MGGGVRMFRISFDNPVATYYGGQIVSGHVIVILDKQINMRGIELKLHGRASVRWTETRTVSDGHGKSRTVHDTYHAHEEYFQCNSYVVGSSHGDMSLPVGQHIFPFSVQLPINLPSSFEGEYGNIRYIAKAKINRPWKFDIDTKVAFTVLSHLDLNILQNVKEPCQVLREKFLCCCCCKSGPITLIAKVPVQGYVPGQDIPVTIELDNISNETISAVSCTIKKLVSFHAHCMHTKTRVVESKVAFLKTESVGPHGSGTWTLKPKVPSVPPSYLMYCSIIDVNYELLIKAETGGLHTDLRMSIPIVIGTIPLMTFFSSMSPMISPNNTPMHLNEANDQAALGWNVAPPPYPPKGEPSSYQPDLPPYESAAYQAPSAPPEIQNLYPDMPPPSYEECMFGKMNIKEEDDSEYTQGDMGFAPRYPMYRFNQ